MIRLSKILFVAAVGLFCLLAAYGNCMDYWVNFSLVQQVLLLKEVMPHSISPSRAIVNPGLQHVILGLIISCEFVIAGLCFFGAWTLFKVRAGTALVFNASKNWAVAGLTLGFLTWNVLFFSIGGEWFGMWMSPKLNGALSTSFHIYMTNLGVLIYLVLKD